jgi:hypothetical protein
MAKKSTKSKTAEATDVCEEEQLDWIPSAVCTSFDLDHPETPESRAKFATDENPANAPALEYLPADMKKIMNPARVAFLTSKWWKATKTKFTVYFMGNPSAAAKARILAFANVINKHCALEFVETGDPSTADFRIADTRDGYWSYLGIDCRSIPVGQQTMNLQGMYSNFSDAEGMRVIPHEFLHGCGAPHEHSRQAIVSRLDPVKTKAVFKRDQGWSAQTVEQQILKVLSESLIFGTPADEFSIMTYWFTGECTKDGRPIVGGKVLSPSDISFLAKTWPKTGPVDPPPPPPPVVGNIVVAADGSKWKVTLERAP